MLGDGLWLAAINHGSLCVVSGDEAHIAALEARLQEEGAEGQRLNTSHAFHSGLMDGAVAPFVKAVSETSLSAPKIPYISNVTGTWVEAAQAQDPAYWGRQIREAVRFGTGVTELLKKEERLFVEVGPGNVLSALVRRQAPGKAAHIFPTLRHAREEGSAIATVLGALGRLWVNGGTIDWNAFYRRRGPAPGFSAAVSVRSAAFLGGSPAGAAGRQPQGARTGGGTQVRHRLVVLCTGVGAVAARDGRPMASHPRSAKHWLVLLDEYQLGDRLVATARARRTRRDRRHGGRGVQTARAGSVQHRPAVARRLPGALQGAVGIEQGAGRHPAPVRRGPGQRARGSGAQLRRRS